MSAITQSWTVLIELDDETDEVVATGLTQTQAEIALCRLCNEGADAYIRDEQEA